MAVFPREGSLLVLISLSCAWMGIAQAPPSTTVGVALTVDSGVPLRLYIDQRLHMRKGEMVRAKLIDPVYSFDRIVIPSGVDVQGHVTRLDPAPKMVRTQAILGGDFTPLHWARVEFTTIVMPDGRTIPIHTADSEGLRTLYVRPKPSSKKTAPPAQSNSGVLGTARQQAAQEIQTIKAKKQEVVDLVRGPNKREWLEDYLIKKLPYHPQWYRRNTRFDAVLEGPLTFGKAEVPLTVLQNIGVPTTESVAAVRLLTSLNSADADTNTKVQGVLSEPIFSADQKLLLPEGTLLTGQVRQARAARWFHRGGQLRFTFDRVEPPASTSVPPLPLQRREAQLAAVESNPQANVKVDSEGGAKATESKARLLGPAIALLVATHAMDNDEGRHDIGGSGPNANLGGRAVGGISGFGLLGAAAARASKPVGAVLGFYGLGWSVYATVISKGKEVAFEKNTAMEIKFGAPASTPAKIKGNHLARAAQE
jgi:hypothetical protein